MAGMRALGRVYDVVNGGTAGTTVALKDCSGVGIFAVGAGAGTLTFTAGVNAGTATTAVTPANGFGQPALVYERATSTSAWTSVTASWSSNALTIGGAGVASYVDFMVSELADTYDYLKVVPSSASTTFILYDLTVQRTPQNLRIPTV